MKNYFELLKNIFIFGFGNIGSKLIVFIMLPFLTAWLSQESYGEMDIVITTIAIVIPLVTLNIVEAIIRFGLDKKNYSLTQVVTNCFIFIIGGFSLLILIYPLINLFPIIKEYINTFYVLLFIQTVHTSIKQFCRTINHLKIYVISDLFYSLLLFLFSFFFIYHFDLGAHGYLFSMILAYIFDVILLSINTKFFNYIKLESIDKSIIRNMSIYCAPLVPNSIMWWAMNVSDRYIITLVLGASANGIYAVASKIPSMVTVIYTIFYKAWQISAIETSEIKNRDKYYSNIFNIFFFIMIILISVMLIFNDLIIKILVSAEYTSVSLYVPILLFSVLFSCLSGFMGSFYLVSKNTNGAFKTSIIGGVFNIILNILLIPMIGLYGASLATLLSFFLTWLLRIKDTKKYVRITFSSWNICISLILISIQIVVMYLPALEDIKVLIHILILMLLIFIGYKYLVKSKG